MPGACVGVNARSFSCKDTNAINDSESLARSGVRLEGLRREGGGGWGGKRRNSDRGVTGVEMGSAAVARGDPAVHLR